MDNFEIDITGIPPTTSQIEAFLNRAQRDIERANMMEQRFEYGARALLMAFVLGMVALWGNGLITAWGAMAVVVAVTIFSFAGGKIVTIFAVSAAILVIYVTTALDRPLTFAELVILALSLFLLTIMASIVYRKWVDTPWEHASVITMVLTELSPKRHPNECAAYYHWYEQDATVRQYQKQVAAQDRNPIMAEYKAAKAWVTEAESNLAEAEKIEKARVACERLRTADL